MTKIILWKHTRHNCSESLSCHVSHKKAMDASHKIRQGLSHPSLSSSCHTGASN
jgi:hypothetical protein